jgi:phage tail-like protein
MDVNGTRFHLFLSRDDWARCSVEFSKDHFRPLTSIWDGSPPQSGARLIWNEEQGDLTLEPKLFNFEPNDTAPSLENRRGAARDVFGNWYWIDETKARIRVLSTGSRVTTDFWPLPEICACPKPKALGSFQSVGEAKPADAVQFSGLAVTEDHYLVVGVIEPKGVFIFDLHDPSDPRQLLWPDTVDFAPFDMAARPGGGVWILDRTNRCYWALDRNFNVIGDENAGTLVSAEQTDDFQPVEAGESRGAPRRTFPASFALAELASPIAIEALPDETVLVLDYDQGLPFPNIRRYRYGTLMPDQISTESLLQLLEDEKQSAFKFVGYDFALVPAHEVGGRRVKDRLYIVGADGNQSYAFRLCLRGEAVELQAIEEYLPMRLFGGKALVGTKTGAYYDFAENWIPLIEQRRPRYVEEATLITPVLDGRDPNCVWHRLMLDACIPPETRVQVWSRAANDTGDLELKQWQAEPAAYLRGDGSEIPFLRTRPTSGRLSARLKMSDGTWELLFQRARGRYLQLRLRLSGDERTTPRLRSVRAYYPRFSYLTHYLPAVYREDEQSASFLDRYLGNLEGLFTTLEDKIAAAQALFDVRTAPPDVLDWLASWFDVALDPSWDEAQRRMFINHAVQFFQYRGTIHGLTMALHLALDRCADERIFSDSPCTNRREEIRIIEKSLTRKIPPVALGDPSDATGLRTVDVSSAWQPEQGRTALSQRYSLFVDPSGNTTRQYHLYAPADQTDADKWAQFSQQTLGFVPSIYAQERTAWQTFLWNRYLSIGLLNAAQQTNYAAFAEISLPRDLPKSEKPQTDWIDFVTSPTKLAERRLWQDFLARRYRRIGALNQAYGTAWTSFQDVALPDDLPPDDKPLNDWFQFETVVLRMRNSAHRFTVLLPVPAALAFDTDEHRRRMELSQRIIELEKPAHTVFDIRFYWAMFRVGDARLQLDTVIDQGSRAPQLLPNLILGQGFLGESYLAPPALEMAGDREVLGRDAIGTTPN